MCLLSSLISQQAMAAFTLRSTITDLSRLGLTRFILTARTQRHLLALHAKATTLQFATQYHLLNYKGKIFQVMKIIG